MNFKETLEVKWGGCFAGELADEFAGVFFYYYIYLSFIYFTFCSRSQNIIKNAVEYYASVYIRQREIYYIILCWGDALLWIKKDGVSESFIHDTDLYRFLFPVTSSTSCNDIKQASSNIKKYSPFIPRITLSLGVE